MRDELRRMQTLGTNWDGYGARPITDAALRAADALEFVPDVEGGVQIELHAGGADIEIEIDQHGWVRSVLWARPKASGQ